MTGQSARVLDRRQFAGRRVFVTGHTGFKGSWLASWLLEMGAQVRGYALAPDTTPNLFDALGLAARLEHREGDIADVERLTREIAEFQPDVVMHLAAQALVRRSYDDPIATFRTNVIGTAAVLQAVRAAPSVRVCVVVTSDKCYENREWVWGYRESDPMGGSDPYSASKGCAELVTASFARSFFAGSATIVTSARAGNVIGGGDWSADRLVPDAMRAFSAGRPFVIRSPHSTRPWQHVLEPLHGYLLLAEEGLRGNSSIAGGWNFGPWESDCVAVGRVAELLRREWGGGVEVLIDPPKQAPKEARLLKLDSSKARDLLAWRPVLGLGEAIELTVGWYRGYHEQPESDVARRLLSEQIRGYESRAQLGKE